MKQFLIPWDILKLREIETQLDITEIVAVFMLSIPE